MKLFDDLKKRFFPPVQHLIPGMYHYQAPPDSTIPYRMHLRLEPDGHGMLILNARTVLHLNHTAAEYAYHMLHQAPEKEVAILMASRYRVPRQRALDDYRDFQERLQVFATTPDLDPVTFLGFDRQDPYSVETSAPNRLDCALTYRQEPGTPGDVAPESKVKRELSTEEWKTILSKAWDAGIPHIIFTGGEPTLRSDLAELISHTQKSGQVSGLLTGGSRLADHTYLDTLLQSGLDHVMILLNIVDDGNWKALEQVLAEDIHTTVHLTITRQNMSQIESILDRLVNINVHSLSLSTDDPSCKDCLEKASQHAADHEMSLIWDIPVPYSSFNPVALELNESSEAVSGAGKAWLYIEPDGDVLPGQGINQVLGNFLTDPWEMIWKKS